MPGILVLIMIVIVIVIVVLFVRDSRRAQGSQTDSAPAPIAAETRGGNRAALDEEAMQALAKHVRELRRAVDEGLIGREEAVASIVRQADGRLGEHVAEQLLDGSELD